MRVSMKKLLFSLALFGGAAMFAVTGQDAQAFPVTSSNNLTGVGAGLAENYVRDAADPDEYLSPFEYTNAINPGAGQMPGHFESVRLDGGGNVVGINIAQPGQVNDPADPRSTINNTLTGTPVWAARAGVVVEMLNNAGFNPAVAFANDSVSAVAYNFTPGVTAAFPPVPPAVTDDGLAPGSVAGDLFPDFAPLNGNVAQIAVGFFAAQTDPSGVTDGTGIFTPKVEIYEGGAPFDAQSNASLLALDEADFNHNTGTPAGPTVTPAVDGTLRLGGYVDAAPSALLTWTFSDTNGVPGLQAGDQVLLDLSVSGGTVIWTHGSLIDDGVVAAGSQGSFGWQLSQEFFLDTPTGTDPNLSQWDFLDLRTAGSNSANAAFEVQTVVPEPMTAGLGIISLLGVAGYASRRRRQA